MPFHHDALPSQLLHAARFDSFGTASSKTATALNQLPLYPLYLISSEQFASLSSGSALAIETHAKRIKAQYDRNVTPRNFSEGDLVLLYDQANDKLGAGKFVSMWHGPYVVKRKLVKGAYELVDFDGVSLGKPRNGLYLKRYYA